MSLLCGQFRGGFEQALRVGMLRAFRDLAGVAYFDDSSAIHHGNPGGEIADDRHGVRDEEIGEAEIALELGEEVDDLGADADVEGGDGFVGDDEFGVQGEGAGDADALALSAGELVGVAVEGGFVEPDSAEEFGDAVAEVNIPTLSQRTRQGWGK